MNRKLLYLLLSAMLMLTSFASAKDFKGLVVDKKTRTPIANVTIESLSGRVISMTDENGRFEIRNWENIKGSKLLFRSIGYSLERVDLAQLDKNDVVIELQEVLYGIDEVVVTGSRTEKHIKDVPVITKVIPSIQIQKMGATDIRDVLTMSIPGVEFGMHGSTQQVSIQGFSGRYLLFLVDGEPLSSQNMDNIDFSRIDVNNIERIEYVAGSGSALYGSSAIGGVINIITKTAQRPWQLQVGTRYVASYDRHFEARGGVNREKFNALLSLRANNRNEYTVSLDDKETGKVKGLDALIGSGKFGYKPNENLKIGGGFNISRSNLHYVKDIQDFLINANQVNLGAFWNIAPKHSLDISGSFDHSKRDSEYLKETTSRGVKIPAGKSEDYFDKIYTGRIQYNFTVPEHHYVNIGGEIFRDDLEAQQYHQTEMQTHGVTNWVLYGQHEWRILPALRFTYGGRLDKHSEFGMNFTPKAALLLKYSNCDFRITYANGFRSPALKELYMHFLHPMGKGSFLIAGNPDLKPESSRRITLQTGYNGRNLSISGSAFYSDIDKKIAARRMVNPDKTWFIQYVNIDEKSVLKGIEGSLRYVADFGLSFQTSYSYTYDDQEIEDGGQKFNLSYTRPHTLTGSLGYSFGGKKYKANINLVGRYLSDVTTGESKSMSEIMKEKKEGTFKTSYRNVTDEGYGSFRLIGTLKCFNAYTLQVGVDNIFNYRPTRSTLNSSLSPGRSFFTSLYVDIDQIFR